jgi:hypothetical protein
VLAAVIYSQPYFYTYFYEIRYEYVVLLNFTLCSCGTIYITHNRDKQHLFKLFNAKTSNVFEENHLSKKNKKHLKSNEEVSECLGSNLVKNDAAMNRVSVIKANSAANWNKIIYVLMVVTIIPFSVLLYYILELPFFQKPSHLTTILSVLSVVALIDCLDGWIKNLRKDVSNMEVKISSPIILKQDGKAIEKLNVKMLPTPESKSIAAVELKKLTEMHYTKTLEQEALERQKDAEEWRIKREEQAKLRVLKESLVASKSEQNTQKIRERLDLKMEKKEVENNRLLAEKEAELKIKQEEKDRLQALKLEQAKIKREKVLAEKKLEIEKKNLQILKHYHLITHQEKERSIAERSLRSLRNFDIDEFTDIELPQKNKILLKKLMEITQEHNIAEIQVYGSYAVFLASIRLDCPINKIRRPGDLDLRVEIETKELSEQLSLIKGLGNIGFVLKGYSEKKAKEKGLAKYISEKTPGGFLNLTLTPLQEDKETYEMELAILFKQHYRANHNPFYLLSHCIKISNNQAAFDGCDMHSRAQLVQDILQGHFHIIPDEMLDPLQYNVFNFFPRLLKNIQAWKDYFVTDIKNIQGLLINLDMIVKFFNIRFSLRMYKECYLELVGLITQEHVSSFENERITTKCRNQFAAPESKLIITGFLIAWIAVINTEALLKLQRKAFFLESIEKDACDIAQKLQDKFSTFICPVHGDPDVNKKVFENFYNYLMTILINHHTAIDPEFLRDSQQDAESILFNFFQKPLCFKYGMPETPRIVARAQDQHNSISNANSFCFLAQ